MKRLILIILCLLFITTAAAQDTAITVENAAQVTQAALLEGHTGPVFSLAFSPDGTTLVSGGSGDDFTVRVWDVLTGSERVLLDGHTAQIAAVSFNADGSQILTASYDGTVNLWDAANGSLVETISESAGGEALGISSLITFFTADGGKLVYQPDSSTTIYMFDLTTREQTSIDDVYADLGENAGLLALSDDGSVLGVEEFDGGAIHLIDLAENTEIGALERFDENSLYYSAMTLSSDHALAAAVDDTSSIIQVWNAATGEQGTLLVGHTAQNTDFTVGVYGLAFNPDNTLLASASYDKTVKLWDVTAGTELVSVDAPAEDGAGVVVWSPDGSRLASGNLDGSIQVWGLPPT